VSGGSGFGLDAASGAQAWLRERGRGLPVRDVRVPIVPSAILFDLLNGGDKDWGRFPTLSRPRLRGLRGCGGELRAWERGRGYGATTFDLKGGLGSASATTVRGYTWARLACVNAIGSAVVEGGPHFWAARFEQDCEFGGLGLPPAGSSRSRRCAGRGGPSPRPRSGSSRPMRP
jgi:L-aminopeptidase/D-esterase-like protein